MNKTFLPILSFIFLTQILFIAKPQVNAYTKPASTQCSESIYATECQKICDFAKKKIAYINEGGIAAIPGEMEQLNSDIANYCFKPAAVSIKPSPSLLPSPSPSIVISPTPKITNQPKQKVVANNNFFQSLFQWFKSFFSHPTPATKKNISPPQIKLTVTKAVPTSTPTLTPTPTIKIVLAPWQAKSANFDCTKTISSMRQDERVVCGKVELNYRSWVVCSNPAKQQAIYDEIYSKYNITLNQLMDQLGQMNQENSEGNVLVTQVSSIVREQCLKSLGLKP